ncbi:MAG TPA: cysteine hydrolase family protein [Candidatus Acidoferrales bacterium]|nr:cysteine hydrolase family protein [Candidatus Acidoferrales bacterium]
MSLSQDTALLIVDVQKGFDDPRWGKRNNPRTEENIAKLLIAWRKSKRPLFHVQHCSKETNSPLHPGVVGNEIKEIVAPLVGESIVKKTVNSAFIGTNLESDLRHRGIDTVVITGLTTDHCVSTTARMAGNFGFKTYVVSDATATFDRNGPDGKLYLADEIHSANLASLHNEFATVLTTEAVLKKLQ